MKRSWWEVVIILSFLIVVQPFVIQYQYQQVPLAVYGGDTGGYYNITSGSDTSITYQYYNTSGNLVSNSLSESYLYEDVTSGTLSMSNQDLTKSCTVFLNVIDTAKWNITSFLTTETEYITVIAVRLHVTGASVGDVYSIDVGFENTGHKDFILNDGTLLDALTLGETSKIYVQPVSYAHADEYQLHLAADTIQIAFREADATNFVNGAVVSIELTFYSGSSYIGFYQYLLLFGILDFILALGMTRGFNPVHGGGYNKSYRSRRNYYVNRYYRRPMRSLPRYRPRRPRFRRRSNRRRIYY